MVNNPWNEKAQFEFDQRVAELKSNIAATENHIAALEKQKATLEGPFGDAKRSAEALFKSLDDSSRTFKDDLRHGSGHFELGANQK